MPTIGIVPSIGPLEIIIVLAIVLIIFGPKRLPELGKSLGQGMRGFKDSVTGKDKDDDEQEKLEASPSKVDAAAPDEREPATAGDDRSTAGSAKPAGDATS